MAKANEKWRETRYWKELDVVLGNKVHNLAAVSNAGVRLIPAKIYTEKNIILNLLISLRDDVRDEIHESHFNEE